VIPAIRTVTWELINIPGVMSCMAYISLVITACATEGPRYRFRFDARHPGGSIKRLLVGLGVRFAAGVVKITDLALDLLYETSPQVGDWIAERSNPETQERFRSHFL
jgi:hypothetical protein